MEIVVKQSVSDESEALLRAEVIDIIRSVMNSSTGSISELADQLIPHVQSRVYTATANMAEKEAMYAWKHDGDMAGWSAQRLSDMYRIRSDDISRHEAMRRRANKT